MRRFTVTLISLSIMCLVQVFVSPAVWGQDVLAYGMTAQEKIAQQEYEKAITWLDRAVKLDPNNTWIRSMRATCHYQLGHFPQALAEYTFIAQLEPTNDTAASMITVIDSLVLQQPAHTKEMPKTSRIVTKPTKTDVVISQEDRVTCTSQSIGFQFPLASGVWDFKETEREMNYQLKCVRQAPEPQIVVQVNKRMIEKELLTEDEEKAAVKEFRQSLDNLTVKQPFIKKTIRGNRTWWGTFETTLPGDDRLRVIRFRWLLSYKGNRLYSLVYSYPLLLESSHEQFVKSILGNFIAFEKTSEEGATSP